MWAAAGHGGSIRSAVGCTVAIAVASALFAACQQPGTPPPTAAAVGGSTQTPAPAASFVGLRAPVAAPQTLAVLNGYDDPIQPANPSPGWCPSPGVNEHDHCRNQQDGLDLVPSDLGDTRILAPLGGYVAWTALDKNELATADCLGIQPTGTTLNLTVCHFERSAIYVHTGETVVTGTVLGQRNPADPWVHLSLDNRYSSWADPGHQVAEPPGGYPPMPFAKDYAIEGQQFGSASPPTFDLHCGATLISSNQPPASDAHASPAPTPAWYAPAPAISCPATAATSPTPTPTPTSAPNLVPAAPAAVTLVSVGDLNCAVDGSSCLRAFTIAWTKVTGATGYTVYLTPVVPTCDARQYAPLTAPQLAVQLSASATRWSSTVRLLNGHYALYSVVATNEAGKSPATVANKPVEGPWGCGASAPPPTPTGLSFTEVPSGAFMSVKWIFSWQEAAGVTAAFRLYDYWTGEGPGPTCAQALSRRSLLAVTAVGATSWSKVTEVSTGGGQHCVWIQAFNNAGASGFAAFPPGY